MKKIYALVALLCASATLVLANTSTSLYFDHAETTSYVKSYAFTTGDSIYFSTGLKTSTSNVCEKSNGQMATYRMQDGTIIIALKSTSMDSVRIYGKPTSTKIRNISKIEVSSTNMADSAFKDITEQITVGHYMQSVACGRQLVAKGIGAKKGDYVKIYITITDPDDESYGVAGKVNISEILVFGSTSTNVEEIREEDIQSIDYFTMLGIPVDDNASGILVEVVTMKNGQRYSRRVYR